MSVPALHSDACIGTILNMQPNTKGIYADDPARFTRWIRTHFPNLKGNSFPPRHVYGVYLSSVLDGVAKDATQLGVTFRVSTMRLPILVPLMIIWRLFKLEGRKSKHPTWF